MRYQRVIRNLGKAEEIFSETLNINPGEDDRINPYTIETIQLPQKQLNKLKFIKLFETNNTDNAHHYIN